MNEVSRIIFVEVTLWISALSIGCLVVVVMRNRGRFRITWMIAAMTAIALLCVAVQIAVTMPKN